MTGTPEPGETPGEGGPPALPAPTPAEVRARNLFVVAIAISAAGSAMLYLAATTIIATNGDPDTAAQRTALYLSLAFLAGLWVPWVPTVGRKVGIARAYSGALVLCAIATVGCGLATVLGDDPVRAMLILAVAVGVPGTVKSVYHPLLVKTFFRTTPFAVSLTWQGIAGATGWTLGSLAGGLIADLAGPALALVVAGLLLLSLPIVVTLERPDVPAPRPGKRERALSAMRHTLVRQPRFRRIVILSAATSIFLLPMSALAVPLAPWRMRSGVASIRRCSWVSVIPSEETGTGPRTVSAIPGSVIPPGALTGRCRGCPRSPSGPGGASPPGRAAGDPRSCRRRRRRR